MEIQKTSNRQSNLEKEDWMEESTCLISDYTTKLQSSRQYDTGTKKEISIEKNRKPRDKSTHLWTPYLQQRRQEYTMD